MIVNDINKENIILLYWYSVCWDKEWNLFLLYTTRLCINSNKKKKKDNNQVKCEEWKEVGNVELKDAEKKKGRKKKSDRDREGERKEKRGQVMQLSTRKSLYNSLLASRALQSLDSSFIEMCKDFILILFFFFFFILTTMHRNLMYHPRYITNVLL